MAWSFIDALAANRYAVDVLWMIEIRHDPIYQNPSGIWYSGVCILSHAGVLPSTAVTSALLVLVVIECKPSCMDRNLARRSVRTEVCKDRSQGVQNGPQHTMILVMGLPKQKEATNFGNPQFLNP